MASSLSEQVEEALSEPVDSLSGIPAGRRAEALFQLAEQTTIAALRALAVADSKSLPQFKGYVSTQRYVAHSGQTSPQRANQLTAICRLMARHDLTEAALADGAFGLAHAELLARAASKFPSLYSANESELLMVAASQDLDHFTDTIARWINAADLDAAQEDSAHRHNTRGLWMQARLDGSGTGNFDLDAIAFATVGQALDAVAGNPDPKQALVHRSLAQRRADALEEMALAYGPQDTASDDTPEPKTEPSTEPDGRRRGGATIEAVINLDFGGSAPKVSELMSDLYRTGPVPHTIIGQLSCDASWRRVLSGASQKLDYASPVADITPNQRRAVRYRDRHCQFHGCDRHFDWCDVHHIISRHDGGPTTLENLTLVCRFHHSLIHQGGWSLTRCPSTGKTQTSSP